MAQGYPSGFNTFVPSFDASGQLVVAFSRNPKDFALNQYVTIVPVKKSSGYYLQITPEQAARVINSNLAEFMWPDGNDAPSGDWALEGFEFKQFETMRYSFPFRIGHKAEEQADWKLLASHAAMYAQQAMTARSYRVLTTLTTTANWPAAHTATATATGGGLINTGTATDPRYKKMLNAMARQINKATIGVVKPKDLIVVIDPVAADELARSQEIHSYLKESPFSLAQVRGDVESQNAAWGLPDTLYGYKHVIDDTVRVSTKKGATTAQGYILSNSLAMVARPGGLTAAEGSRNFSTIHVFAYEEMTVEQKDDPDNRRIAGRVVEDYDVRLVAPVSGFLLTATLS